MMGIEFMMGIRQLARGLIEQQSVSVDHVWAMYWGEGGILPLWEFEAYLYEAYEEDRFNLVILTWAVEALMARRGEGRPPFS